MKGQVIQKIKLVVTIRRSRFIFDVFLDVRQSNKTLLMHLTTRNFSQNTLLDSILGSDSIESGKELTHYKGGDLSSGTVSGSLKEEMIGTYEGGMCIRTKTSPERNCFGGREMFKQKTFGKCRATNV